MRAHVAMHEGDRRDVLNLAPEQEIRQVLASARILGRAWPCGIALPGIEIVHDKTDGPLFPLNGAIGLRLDGVDHVTVDWVAHGNEDTVLASGRLSMASGIRQQQCCRQSYQTTRRPAV